MSPGGRPHTAAAETPTRRQFLLAAIGTVVAPPALITVSGRTLIRVGLRSACAIGRGGIRADKREGDGATPAGRFALRRVLFRRDRISAVESGLPVTEISKVDGWCTDPRHAAYNQPVKLPFASTHEDLWRDDGLYDVIIVIGYNDSPVVPGKGSAIFLHVARPTMSPTDGCVAVSIDVILDIARHSDATTLIDIRA